MQNPNNETGEIAGVYITLRKKYGKNSKQIKNFLKDNRCENENRMWHYFDLPKQNKYGKL